MSTRDWGEGSQKVMVSSAYWRCVRIGPSLHIATPDHRFKYVALLINKLRASTIRTKRKGEKGSPCGRPRCSLKESVGVPFNRTDATAEEIQGVIHIHQVIGNPIFNRIQSKKSHDIQPKALWKSNFKVTS